jgi:hypothetical protein
MPGSMPGMMAFAALADSPPSHNFDAARLMLSLFGQFTPLSGRSHDASPP